MVCIDHYIQNSRGDKVKLIFATLNVPRPGYANVALDMSGMIHVPGIFSVYNLRPTLNNIYRPDFDSFYNEYLIQNDLAFMDLMKIMYSLYENLNVIVYYYDNFDQVECITQLQRFLESRYGIVPNYAFNEVDVDDHIIIDTEFSVNGLYNIDADKIRYIEMLNGVGTNMRQVIKQQQPKKMYTKNV